MGMLTCSASGVFVDFVAVILGFGQKGSGVIGLNEIGFMVSRHAKLIAHY